MEDQKQVNDNTSLYKGQKLGSFLEFEPYLQQHQTTQKQIFVTRDSRKLINCPSVNKELADKFIYQFIK